MVCYESSVWGRQFWFVTLARQYGTVSFGALHWHVSMGPSVLARYSGMSIWGRQFWCVTLARQYEAVSFGALHWHVSMGPSVLAHYTGMSVWGGFGALN